MTPDLTALTTSWPQQIPKLLGSFRGIVVACSGGLDSTVLFHLLCQHKKNHPGLPLAVTHINYQLRGAASDEAEAHVLDLARSANLPLFSFRISTALESTGGRRPNLQSWARRLRYQYFTQLANEGWLIAMAHHRDDAAENTLLRLARGSSPGSLLGMKERYRCFWRPLLSISKKDLLAWSQEQHLSYCEDASNQSLEYSRNVIRHQLLPLLELLYPGAGRRIVRCAEQAREFVEASEPQFRHWIELSRGKGLPCSIFHPLPEGLACHLLASLMGMPPEGKKRLSHKLLLHLYRRIVQIPAPDFTEELPANMGKIQVKAQVLSIIAAPRPSPKSSQGSKRAQLIYFE